MAFDSSVLAAVVCELNSHISGARINKIHQSDAHTVLLRYHAAQGSGKLLLSCHPQNGRLHRTESSPENPAKAPLFAMVLRKWLEGAKIQEISATEGERVATFFIDGHDELGDVVQLRLIVEIMGKHSNIILVHENGQIIDGIRRYGSSLSRYREVLPGRPYKAPPPFNRLPLPPRDEDQLAEAIYAEADRPISDILQRSILGLSPLLAKHSCLAANIPLNASGDTLGSGQINQLYQVLTTLKQQLTAQDFQPTLWQKGTKLLDFAALPPLQWPQPEQLAADSMNAAVELFYAAKEQEQRFLSKRQSLQKQLQHHEARLLKKIALQEEDFARSEAAEAYKEAGDLLSAYQWQLTKGMTEAALPSFADAAQTVSIALDGALSPIENIQRYYRRYAKAKKASSQIAQQLAANHQELSYLQSIQQSVEQTEQLEELAEPEREGIAAGFLKPASPAGRQKAPTTRPQQLPPRQYCSSDGFTVLIGRNNKQNERLSLREAAADDIWLHTQKIPGSHVIVVSGGKTVPEQTLAEAASWAAWFSKARDSAQVPVDYLPAGKLKKPANTPPGFVIFSGQKTLYVTPAQPPEA